MKTIPKELKKQLEDFYASLTTIDELHEVDVYRCDLHNKYFSSLNNKIKGEFKIGDEVEILDEEYLGEIFTIKKINKVMIKLNEKNNKNITVPPRLLRKIN